ncbi:MAG TPA: hypothetical protein VM143_05145 [Acidimicrobiales bacterium]|nr:hypothetical protein [Acidimicrobiales bacterium]
MIIAIVVLMVLSLLTIGMLARTISSQRQVRSNQDFNGALASADAGISDALFQLDQLDPSVAPSTVTRSNVAVGNGDSFGYTATPIDENKYTIRSSGTVNGVRHDVMVTAKRRRRFDYVFYGRSTIKINGNCGSFLGPIGTANTITGTGNAPNCVPTADCYLRDDSTMPALSEGCGDRSISQYNPNGKRLAETNFKPPVQLPPSTAGLTDLGCPGTTVGPNTTIDNIAIAGSTTGYYNCSTNVILKNTVTVSGGGDVLLYVMGGTVDTGNLNALNDGGAAVRFQIYGAKTSSLLIRGSTRVYAGIYSPSSAVVIQPGATIKGSIVADSVEINGAPNLGVLDQSLSKITIEDWKIADYREVPSTCTVNC